MDITTIHRSGFLSAQIRTTLNDLECPVQLKVHFTDGTLDVRLLRVSDSTGFNRTHRSSQRGRGSGLEGLAPSNPCGQLTRCFSAVAELLVNVCDAAHCGSKVRCTGLKVVSYDL